MKTQNGYTLKQEQQFIHQTNIAKDSQKFATVEELMKDLETES